jgi:hypothetical protein
LAASQLGLTGVAALAYANELVSAHLENQKDEDNHFALRQIQAEK